VALALILNVTWAADILCEVTTTDSNGVISTAGQTCDAGVLYCFTEKDANDVKTRGCGLCPNGPGANCEQCVGNDQSSCNKEGAAHGPKCDVTLTDGVAKTSVFCAEGVTLCYSPTGTNNDFTTFGCGFCPEGKQGNGVDQGCKQCVGNSDTQCNTDTYKPGAQCYVENKLQNGLTPVDCTTDTVLCYSPSSAYKGITKEWSKFGCGFCPETEKDCIQCEGTACNRNYDKKVDPDSEIYCAVTTKTFSRNSLTPITLPARCGAKEGIKYCYGRPVMGTPDYTKYGCGGCSGKGNDCEVCLGNNEVPCTPLIKDDEKKDYNHGNVMMLNTLLLPLLLALWV